MSKNINRIIRILTCISVLVTGICFVFGCLSIYKSGEDPYTRARVGAVLKKLIIPVVITVILAVSGFISDLFGSVKATPKAKPVHKMRIQSLNNRRDFECVNNDELSKIQSEKKKRIIVSTVCMISMIAGLTLFSVYALNINNFPVGTNHKPMIKAMTVLVMTCGIPFAFSVFTFCFNEKSLKSQADYMQSIAMSVPKKEPQQKQKPQFDRIMTVSKVLIAVIGITMIIYGVFGGGTSDVFTKAINLCRECVGIG